MAFLLALGVAGCALPGQRQQLDLLWARFAQQGSGVTARFTIPDGRYTVFVRDFPVACLTNLTLANDHGVVSAGPHGTVLLTQADLAGGSYRFEVDTSAATCAWEIQTVLNSVPGGTTPKPPPLELTYPAPVSLSSHTTDSFDVSAVGAYSVTYAIGPASGPPCSFNLRLLGPGPLVQPVGAGGAGGSGVQGLVLLASGRWRVDAGTSCPWTVRVAPSKDGGGGAIGF